MGTLKRTMPDECFQGKVWKHSPPIVKCVSCGLEAAIIGNSTEFISTAFGYLCSKKACREKLRMKPVEP